MDWPLYWRLPAKDSATSDQILERFLDYIQYKELELYPAQEEAILQLVDGQNVILNTPTGSGKSLVALALHFDSLARGKKSYYTCPIKALVNEKFRDLCAVFGPDQVGLMTGDGSVNAEAPIICCTAEVLSNFALRMGDQADIQDVVMDEFHYYSDRQRGVAWQIPLLTMPHTRFLLMSATMGDVEFFARELTQLTQRPTSIVQSTDRPVPLEFEYRETPLHETLSELVRDQKYPIYLVNFSQREASEEAQNLLSVDFSTKEEKKKIAEELIGFQFKSPFGKDLQRLVKHGVGLHHAGLLPKYRILVEKLAQKGLLKVISGTDTLGVGVNVPIRTVVFTKLSKYNGDKQSLLTARDFHQIAGRAGRRGYDTRGYVVSQAPEHVIENNRAKQKAALNPAKAKKVVLKAAPPGFVNWSKETFEKLQQSKPEPLVSQFEVSHGMILNVLSRPHARRQDMQKIIRSSHESEKNKKVLRKRAFSQFRSLVDRGIIEWTPGQGSAFRINIDLQEDFSLHHALSLYFLDAIGSFDSQSPQFALDVMTLAESIIENPEVILRKQLDRAKTLRMQELKAEGMEYDQRIEELEKVEYPRPLKEFIYETFQAFMSKHPWVGHESIRPKSIAREMYEGFYTFADYIKEYGLQRSEGVLLRYISEVYKVLEQSVPERMKTSELLDLIAYFESMIRLVDSSLLEDWLKMKGEELPQTLQTSDVNERPKISNGFKRRFKQQIYMFFRELTKLDDAAAADLVDGVSKERLESFVRQFEEKEGRLSFSLEQRHPQYLETIEDQLKMTGRLTLINSEGERTEFTLVFEAYYDPQNPEIVSLKWVEDSVE